MVSKNLLCASQRYEEGNNSLYLINGYYCENGSYEESNKKGTLVPGTEDFVRERD